MIAAVFLVYFLCGQADVSGRSKAMNYWPCYRAIVLAFVIGVFCGVVYDTVWWHRAEQTTASPPAALPPMVERLCIMDSTDTDVYEEYVVPSKHVAGWCHATGEKVSYIVGITHGGAWQVGVLQEDTITKGQPARIEIPQEQGIEAKE
jgi:hypothetical protein